MPEIVSPLMFTPFEPKLSQRFVLEVDGIPAYMIKVANRPTYTAEIVEIDYINVKRKTKGKSNWDDVEMTLYDPIAPSGAQAVNEWILQSHESETGKDNYGPVYKKDINFFALGPEGDKIEQWTLKGAFITNATFGEFDWSNTTDPANITVTMAYDYAQLVF